MRWWLALAFASIAALTALSVTEVFTSRSEEKIRERSRELAAGEALTAALEISAVGPSELRSAAQELGAARKLAIFVFDPEGRLLTSPRVDGVAVRDLSNFSELRSTALAGRRVVDTIDGGRIVTVALPLRGNVRGALVAVAPRSDLEDALGIVRAEIVRAALVAIGIGAAIGLLVATLITRRLRRIARAAHEIEQGNFDRELQPRFHDELGELAETIDGMRARLRDSFVRLEDEKDRLRRLLEQLQEGVVAVDRDLVVEFANARAQDIIGEELVAGSRLPDPWPTASLPEAAQQLFAAGSSSRTLYVQPAPDTSYAVALLPPSRASRSSVVVITDVSQQERRERAEREFVMNAAHELRTPLAAIAGAVEALQSGAKDDHDDRDRFLSVVDRQTQRLTRLTHALLTLARAQTRSEPVKLEPVAVAPVLHEVADELPTSPVVSVCCDDVVALAHPDLLRQALENLTVNALRHANGADVVLSATHSDDGSVRIDVADNGPGMPGHDAARAVDRFYRARDADGDGFGLGLAIVREVVDAMEGTVSIESAPEAGTTVSLVLKSDTRGGGCR